MIIFTFADFVITLLMLPTIYSFTYLLIYLRVLFFFFNSTYLQIHYNHLQVSVYIKTFIFRLPSHLHQSHFIFSLKNHSAPLFCHFQIKLSFFVGDHEGMRNNA